MTAIIEEQASAKINLTLRVIGRRPDGYHELESLVAFAAHGDRLALHPGTPVSLRVTGPFAAAIDGPNLVEAAVHRAHRADPSLKVGGTVLEKNLPVAAGLGGGSADAAAALRAIQRANPDSTGIDWLGLAAGLGADVPVCLAGTPAVMRGIGERLEPVASFPSTAMVLANPGVPLATADVFRALGASALSGSERRLHQPLAFAGLGDLSSFLDGCGNDLEAPATALCPAIADVRAALAAAPGALCARMSGSGPTCLALFARDQEAAAAAAVIARHAPRWWVVATRLG
jgi:4-diphosphocytidyl-2-C-methyl-D-erythritol kinase